MKYTPKVASRRRNWNSNSIQISWPKLWSYSTEFLLWPYSTGFFSFNLSAWRYRREREKNTRGQNNPWNVEYTINYHISISLRRMDKPWLISQFSANYLPESWKPFEMVICRSTMHRWSQAVWALKCYVWEQCSGRLRSVALWRILDSLGANPERDSLKRARHWRFWCPFLAQECKACLLTSQVHLNYTIIKVGVKCTSVVEEFFSSLRVLFSTKILFCHL